MATSPRTAAAVAASTAAIAGDGSPRVAIVQLSPLATDANSSRAGGSGTAPLPAEVKGAPGSPGAPPPNSSALGSAPGNAPPAPANVDFATRAAAILAEVIAAAPSPPPTPIRRSRCLFYSDGAALFRACVSDADKLRRLAARHPKASVGRDAVLAPAAAPAAPAAVAGGARRGGSAAAPQSVVTWHAEFHTEEELNDVLTEHRTSDAIDRPHRCINCSEHHYRLCGVSFQLCQFARIVVTADITQHLPASSPPAASDVDVVIGNAGFGGLPASLQQQQRLGGYAAAAGGSGVGAASKAIAPLKSVLADFRHLRAKPPTPRPLCHADRGRWSRPPFRDSEVVDWPGFHNSGHLDDIHEFTTIDWAKPPGSDVKAPVLVDTPCLRNVMDLLMKETKQMIVNTSFTHGKRNICDKFQHPITEQIIVAAPDWKQRKSVCDDYLKLTNNAVFRWRNQSWARIGRHIFDLSLGIPDRSIGQLQKSNYPIELMMIYEKATLKPLIMNLCR